MSGFPLSEEQLAAVTSEKNHLLIIAPPGCGKTEVLAHRAAHQLGSLRPNQKVLALTFTKRARANLEERLRFVLGQTRARRQIVVRNFHGFAAQIILAHGRTIELSMDGLKLPETKTMQDAMKAAGDSGPRGEAEKILTEIKKDPLSDEEVLDAIRQRERSEAVLLAEKVEQSRQEANQLHYEDLLRHAQRLLRIPAIARLYQAHFGAVLIDEFQDLTLQQFDIATLACSERRTFAGDPLQGIFSWAGAAPAEVEAKVRRSCGDPIRLRESYRSSPMVLETVNSISKKVDPESGLISALPNKWPGGGCSAGLVFQDQTAEAKSVTRLATFIHGVRPESSIGIITRATWRMNSIDTAFADCTDTPVCRWNTAIEDPATVALIQSVVARLPRGAKITDARLEVLTSMDSADIDARQLVNEAFDTLEKSGATTARAALRSIKTTDPKQAIGPGVHLLNAHAGKGQQFDWAFVIGLEEGHLPSKRNSHGDALDEEQRALLVMLSRARHGVIVTRTRMREGWYGPRPAAESRWWSAIQTRFSSENEIRSHIKEYLKIQKASA